jgi:hypothetical protein
VSGGFADPSETCNPAGETGHYLNPRSSTENCSKLVDTLREQRCRLTDLELVFSSRTNSAWDSSAI